MTCSQRALVYEHGKELVPAHTERKILHSFARVAAQTALTLEQRSYTCCLPLDCQAIVRD